jgi:hypothetical protein
VDLGSWRPNTGLIDRVPEPPRQIAPRRRARPAERLTPPESERFVAALDPPWRLLAELVLLTSPRVGEMVDRFGVGATRTERAFVEAAATA